MLYGDDITGLKRVRKFLLSTAYHLANTGHLRCTASHTFYVLGPHFLKSRGKSLIKVLKGLIGFVGIALSEL